MAKQARAKETRKATAKAVDRAAAGKTAARRSMPLTVSRPELLIKGSDSEFRRLVHGLLGFLARHEASARVMLRGSGSRASSTLC